ncbi:UNVERIFIED_CONTAM: protein LONG AFTER FAR-RED 3 [Sesamum latifolium]|uniref:Protein LONG AFTER FAR-RED 3 n=1 Tax=Sesamum latifolium TaxID=2727402 RepID=A0AAW2XQ84_9LAMI
MPIQTVDTLLSHAEPTGLLIDSAMKLVMSCIPEVSVEERREALLRAANYALTRGVTSVVDLGRYLPGASPELSWEDFSDVYKWADLSGKMKIRVCLFFPMETWTRLHPYVDEPLNYGLQVTDTDMLYNMTLSSDKAGLQIEHAQHLAHGAAARFGEQEVIASVQVADINPLGSIKTAVKRVPPGWTNAWIPSERISLSDALNGYTISAARSCFLDEDVGSLSPGKMADFVVLSVDSWDILLQKLLLPLRLHTSVDHKHTPRALSKFCEVEW